MQNTGPLGHPARLGPVTAPNRIVMPPLVIWRADHSGTVTDEHLAHYRATSGAGVMIVEATAIAPEGRLAAEQLGIWSDDQLPGLALLARAIRESGSVPGIQLHHAGGSTTTEKTCGLAPVVPSLLESSPESARELGDDETGTLIEAFAAAVRRALEAGYSVIELHGAHGYLISQFLSPQTNLRLDRWGGSPIRRRTFLTDAISASRREIERTGKADSTALGVRLGLAAGAPRALSLKEGCAAARAAVDAGVDFLDISHAGAVDAALSDEIRRAAGAGRAACETDTLLLAAIARAETAIPVIGVGGIRTPERAAAVLEAGCADLVAVGRGLLADPRWARKALGTDDRPLEPCVDCKPRCLWFSKPAGCPARRRLAERGEQPAIR